MYMPTREQIKNLSGESLYDMTQDLNEEIQDAVRRIEFFRGEISLIESTIRVMTEQRRFAMEVLIDSRNLVLHQQQEAIQNGE